MKLLKRGFIFARILAYLLRSIGGSLGEISCRPSTFQISCPCYLWKGFSERERFLAHIDMGKDRIKSKLEKRYDHTTDDRTAVNRQENHNRAFEFDEEV